jgi:hypothetical protein
MGTQKSPEASMSTTKSGFQVGTEYVERLKRYSADVATEGRPLPARGGKPNASAIALACGFDRQVLYKRAAKELFDKAVRELDVEPAAGHGKLDDEKAVARCDPRDQRILKLEQENASLRAERADLRARLRRLRRPCWISRPCTGSCGIYRRAVGSYWLATPTSFRRSVLA